MLFVNQKSVKYPELLTAVVLSQTFYRDTSLYVGDKDNQKLVVHAKLIKKETRLLRDVTD